MQGRESTSDDPLQPRQSFYGGQNTIYNSLQGSQLSPSATTQHSASHNVNPTTRAQQLYVAAVNSSLGTSPPLSPRLGISSGSLPASPAPLPSAPTIPYTSRGTQIMSGMYQPQFSSPTSQIYYHHHQRESSFSIPESTQNSFQGPMATDTNAGPHQSAMYTQPFPQQQHAHTATSNVDAFGNSTNSTRSSASFHARLNLGSQINVPSLPVQYSHDSIAVGHAGYKPKALSGKLGKVSKNVAKLALKVAGSAVETTTTVPVSTEAIMSLVDVAASLINRYASRERNSTDISRTDLEAVFQGAPNAKYEEVIRALILAQVQQQKALGSAPAFNIQVLIDELRRLQALANAHVRAVQGQTYPSFGQMGVAKRSGLMGPGLMNKVHPIQSHSQVQPDALPTHAPMAAAIQPEHAVYSSWPGIEPKLPCHILQDPASLPQFYPQSSLISPSMDLPAYQVHVASDARLYRDLREATEWPDNQDVSNDKVTGPASLLPADVIHQQAQLQTTLLQQHQQMTTLLQQQQQQLMQILLEQKQEIKEERTLSADFSSEVGLAAATK